MIVFDVMVVNHNGDTERSDTAFFNTGKSEEELRRDIIHRIIDQNGQVLSIERRFQIINGESNE